MYNGGQSFVYLAGGHKQWIFVLFSERDKQRTKLMMYHHPREAIIWLVGPNTPHILKLRIKHVHPCNLLRVAHKPDGWGRV